MAGQRADPDALVHRYRSLLALRQQHPDMWRAPLEWIETSDPLVATLRRGSIAVISNLSSHRANVSLGSPGWQFVFASRLGTRLDSPKNEAVSVPAETTVVLARGPRL